MSIHSLAMRIIFLNTYHNSRSPSIYPACPTTEKCKIKFIPSSLVRQYDLSSSCYVVIKLIRSSLLQEEAPVHPHVKRSPPLPEMCQTLAHFTELTEGFKALPLQSGLSHTFFPLCTHSHSGSNFCLPIPNFLTSIQISELEHGLQTCHPRCFLRC